MRLVLTKERQETLRIGLVAVSIFIGLLAPATGSARGLSEAPFAGLDRLEDQALKRSLNKITTETHTRRLDYRAARIAIMGELHLQRNDAGYFIKDVYCQHEFTERECGTLKPGQLPSDKVINVEHTWPQSRFRGSEQSTMKSDLHHLFPSDSQMNALRGNHKFGDVTGPTEDIKCHESAFGLAPNGRGYRFEPPREHKGNVARALFYFSVRYSLPIDADEEQALRNWNESDPVDASEKERNEKIAALQGNKNPFIEHPEFVNHIADF